MLVVRSPAQFPDGIKYVLHVGKSSLPNAENYIETFAPSSLLVSTIGEEYASITGGQYVVITSLDWPNIVDHLLAADISPDAIILFLYTPHDPWSFFPYSRWFADDLNKILLGNTLPIENISNHLTSVGEFSVRGKDLVPTKDAYYFTFEEEIINSKEEIDFVRRNFGDGNSRDLFDLLLTGTADDYLSYYHHSVFRSTQYFDYVDLTGNVSVLDGGIHGGHELPFYLALLPKIAKVICVDPIGFDQLAPSSRTVVEHNEGQFIEVRKALWNENEPVFMKMTPDLQALGASSSDRKEDEAYEEFQGVTVDRLVAELGLTALDHIKFDLEGAEVEAIEGMSATLAEFRPSLAISIYHLPEHLWEIPANLMRSLKDYRFHLGQYSYHRYETILYAIPD